MPTATRKKGIVTTAGVLYTKPARRRSVRKNKLHVHLSHDKQVQVATLMRLTQIPTPVIARMFNICEATAYKHSTTHKGLF